jgi:hypothetical protein
MSLLKQYLSLESAAEVEVEIKEDGGVVVEIEVPEVQPVSEDEVYEAEETLDNTAAIGAAEQAAIAEADQVAEELDDRSAALENFCEILSHGIEHGQYSPQFAALVSTGLEEYSALFGEPQVVASLENYGHENLEEFYKLALEDFTEKLYKLKGAVDRASVSPFLALANKARSATRSASAIAVRKKADALLEKLAQASGAKASEVSLKGLKAKLAVKGAVPSNLLQAVKNDQRAVQELLDTYATAGLKYNDELAKTLDSAVKKVRAKDKDGAVAEINAFAKKPRPEDKLSAGIRDGSALLGNVALKFDAAAKVEDGKGLFKAEAKRGAPKLKSLGGDIGGSDSIELSLADIKALLVAAKAYSVLIEKANGSITNATKGITYKSTAEKAYANHEGDFSFKIFKTAEIQDLNAFWRAYPSALTSLISDSFGHATDSAKALLALAERAIGKLGKSEKKDD